MYALDGLGGLNAKAAVDSAPGSPWPTEWSSRSSPCHGPAGAGGRVQARVYARWNDGAPVAVGALPSCRIWVRGTALRATSALDDGVVRCTFTLPEAPPAHR